ncbi:MAG: AMP-binding protein [candidate division NC10 bacterium]|nr:AMP-binding protein [candidate division NC10 bacterium]
MDLAGTQTLGEILPLQASRADLAGKPALFFDDQAYTYADLQAASAAAADHLRARGISAGDVVGLILPNAPALVAHLFGILRIGATVLPLNPNLTPRELSLMLEDSRARAIVTTGDLALQLGRVRSLTPSLKEVIAVHPGRPLERAAGTPGSRIGGSPDETAFLVYTAGTTGRPKGVMLTHRNVLANTAQVAERTGLAPADRVLHVMPLFHVNGLINNTILPLRVGASIVLRPRFDIGEFWGVVASFRPTYFTAVPTMFARLMDAWDGRADTSSLRFVRSGAAPMAAALQRQVEERLAVPVVLSYGLTEATCTCTMNPADPERRVGSVGLALPREVVAVLDEGGRPRGPGEVGEVVVQGPNVMAGYLNAPEATAQALRGGCLYTGDLGYLDPDGFLFLTDRKKDLIIRGGENISPREVEEALLAHPAVAEAAVVGTPDREWGEEVVAFLVPRGGRVLAVDEVQAFCRERLARYKVPRRIQVVPALPLTSLGKVDKARLRSLLTPDQTR